ncbi:MAG TPA: extracellular solute-binding protein, partial [Anaerolineaceae bacterium]|nr:extracellular solute-binding protein [Anaerolineaceae bacterium]
MSKKVFHLFAVIGLVAILAAACAPAATPTTAVQPTAAPVQVEVTRIVAGTPEVQQVVVTATSAPSAQQLLVFNWWTGPGEREAADAMYKAFSDKYPDIKIVDNPVPGGGGVNIRVVLQARLTAGLPPDTWQTLGGAELKNYVDSKALQPLDDIYKSLDYASKIPKPLLNAVTIDGHPYSVPLNMHIQNILYYNKKLFTDQKLTPPTNYDELLKTCQSLKTAKPDMTCIALGSKEKWEDAFVFDSVLIGEPGGAKHYVDIYKGNVDVSTDADYLDALKKYAALVPFFNTDHSSLTWDQAVGVVGAGKAAMTLMGTWAIGAFKSGSNWTPGVDFGAVTFPSNPDRVLLFHPDTYGMAVGAPDPDATQKWLGVVASQELQIPTDVTQGGLFARTDIDPTKFPDPIRQEMQDYVSKNPGKLILDQHGSILPATVQPKYWDAMATFTTKPTDVSGTAKAIQTLFTTYDVKTGS